MPQGLIAAFGRPESPRDLTAAMADGPITLEEKLGGARALAVRETICQFWALTDQAHQQIRALRKLRALAPGGFLTKLTPDTRSRLEKGLSADLAYFRAERHRCQRRLARIMARL